MAAKQTTNKIDPNLLLIGGGAALFYFGVMDPLLKAIGLKDDKEDKEADKELETAETSPGWDPKYYLQNRGKGYRVLTADSAIFLADEIAEARGWFNDDEERIYSAFRMIGDHFQLAQVSDAYILKYRSDLYADLRNWLSEKEFLYIAVLVNKLPPYRK